MLGNQVEHVLVFGVVRNRVLIATPDGPATGFTPRHFRNFAAVTHSILADTYDKLGSSTTGLQTRQLPHPSAGSPGGEWRSRPCARPGKSLPG